MEDYRIDMVLPDGGSVSLPLQPFTLIGATTKPESLSIPLKNRFIYSFHLEPYTQTQKTQMLKRYLHKHTITITNTILAKLAEYTTHTPREITTMSVQVRDYLLVHTRQGTS